MFGEATMESRRHAVEAPRTPVGTSEVYPWWRRRFDDSANSAEDDGLAKLREADARDILKTRKISLAQISHTKLVSYSSSGSQPSSHGPIHRFSNFNRQIQSTHSRRYKLPRCSTPMKGDRGTANSKQGSKYTAKAYCVTPPSIRCSITP